MPTNVQLLAINDLTGGRNAIDAPGSPLFGQAQATELLNIDFYQTTLGRKRNGMSSVSLAFSAGGPFTGRISTIVRHVPGADETAAEVWMVDSAATPVIGRKTAGASFTQPTRKDEPTGNGWDVSTASISGKLYLAYNSGINRMHVWDSVNATIRRTGFPTPAAPTVANTGVGSYAATLRYYRVRWTEQQSGVTVRRSEPSASTSFTPSGTGTAARVTRPALASENESHWELEASTDNVTFYLLTTVAQATTTYDDSAAPSTYSSGTVSAITGVYSAQGTYKFIAGDQNRLLGFGSYVSTNKQNRVEFSAVAGSLDIGDTERVNTSLTYFVDLDEQDSGDPTGLEGPVLGNYYAFKVKQLWELRPTGDVSRPYARSAVSKTIGAVSPRAHCIGEDQQGQPALYFMSHRGMYRYGIGGLRYIGKGIEDLVSGTDFTNFTNRINLSARVPCHMVYHADRGQVWVWWATGTSTTADPSQCAVYHVASGGWSRYLTEGAGLLELARCSALCPRTLGASSARDLKPYLGDSSTNNTVYMADDTSATQDGTTSFAARIDLGLLNPWGPGKRGQTHDLQLLARNQAGVTLTCRSYPEGKQTAYQTSTALLTQTAADTFASRRLEGSAISDAEFVQFAIGEFAAANTASWTILGLTVPWAPSQTLSG